MRKIKDFAKQDKEVDFGRVPNYVLVREMANVISEDLVRSHFFAKKDLSK